MRIIGITGGVGAGKSTVLHTLYELTNCEIVMADDVAKDLMKYGEALTETAIALFGKDAYVDGVINREHLSKMIYNNPELRKEWENAVHPATNSKIKQLIEQAMNDKKDFIFIEAALLIENHYEEICDEIWYVYADENIRRKRLKDDRQYSDDKIDKIYLGQMKDEEFRKYCNFVIDTSGSFENTRKQLENKLEEY